MKRICGCGSTAAICPECGKQYPHGTQSRCGRPHCEEVNAPLDCMGCGFVVSADLDGVIDFDGRLLPYR